MTATPCVLFVCVHNAGRSQMAAAYLSHLAGDHAEVPKVLTDQAVVDSDVVITMGCGDVCPVCPGKRYEDWTLTDPAGQVVASVRPMTLALRISHAC